MKVFYKLGISILALILISCGIKPTVFIHSGYDFRFLEKIVVIPFDNLSREKGAGLKITRIFINEMLSAEAFDVVEPGEVKRVLQKHSLVRTAELSKEQIISIGKDLNAQGIILGSVTEYSTMRSGSSNISVITMVVRMVETETGETIWTTTHSAKGKGFLSSLFGGRGKSQSEVSRDCVKSIINTLIK